MHQMFARRSILSYCIAAVAGAALLAAAPSSEAETMQFNADLKGSSQVPSSQTSGIGTVTVTYDSVTKRLSWKGSYSGLSGPASAAHFHGPAEPGKNAGVAVAIPNATSSPAEGSAILTDAQAADLKAGRYYINVHTAANPGGEIRGQVTK